MSKYRYGGLLSQCIGDTESRGIAGHTVRKETALVDGERFYRFTLNPGRSNEFGTFWSADEERLLKMVYKRIGLFV